MKVIIRYTLEYSYFTKRSILFFKNEEEANKFIEKLKSEYKKEGSDAK